MKEQSAPILPELRQELRLEQGARGPDGLPTWLIVDPAQHRYVQIDETAHLLLAEWQQGADYASLQRRIVENHGPLVSMEEIAAFVRFLADNHLTVEPAANGWRHYAHVAARGKHGWLMWMVHNYLFIRIPLVRPEAVLRRLQPFVALFYTRGFALFVLSAGLLGLYLASRQWDAFVKTFQYFFSWQGAAIYAVALALIKSAHELGHAFTAMRFGCRVPSMGICFMVMVPMLYTDVTDAWRLQDRRQRLFIGAAGVLVELMLACFATLAWPFLPEGVLKSLAFSIATVGWVLSLMVNLNPLMRFDGYYLFGDALGVDNLQARAFAFGQWRLRELLFDLKAPPPEQLPVRTSKILTAYAWSVWIYRFVLFTGIALLVYHMTFKILGIVLFLIEIIYFVLRPIVMEMRRWMLERQSIGRSPRARYVGATLTLLVVTALVPWSTRISVPAVLEAAEISRVYPQRAGIVQDVRVEVGQAIKAGDVLAVLESPEIAQQISVAKRRLALIKLQLARRSADQEDRAKSLVNEKELASVYSELAGLQHELDDLVIRSPQDGVVAEFNSWVHPGRPIGRAEFVALVRGTGKLVARGYMTERDVARVHPSSEGSFVPEEPGYPRYPVRLEGIAKAGTLNVDILELASVHGGAVAVRPQAAEQGHKKLFPVEANYLATLSAGTSNLPAFSLRGTVLISGDGQSLASRVWRQVAAVLVRESGF